MVYSLPATAKAHAPPCFVSEQNGGWVAFGIAGNTVSKLLYIHFPYVGLGKGYQVFHTQQPQTLLTNMNFQ